MQTAFAGVQAVQRASEDAGMPSPWDGCSWRDWRRCVRRAPAAGTTAHPHSLSAQPAVLPDGKPSKPMHRVSLRRASCTGGAQRMAKRRIRAAARSLTYRRRSTRCLTCISVRQMSGRRVGAQHSAPGLLTLALSAHERYGNAFACAWSWDHAAPPTLEVLRSV